MPILMFSSFVTERAREGAMDVAESELLLRKLNDTFPAIDQIWFDRASLLIQLGNKEQQQQHVLSISKRNFQRTRKYEKRSKSFAQLPILTNPLSRRSFPMAAPSGRHSS